MAHVSGKRFPLDAKEYELYEEIGDGVSATVYKARCVPLNEVVAIKVLDLEKCNNDLDGIRREVQTMSLISHPNLLRAHCSFTAGHNLWVVMPFMAEGSCLHIMKSAFPDGFEEPVIATLLCEVLKALVYLHAQGHIHRDVKAGNILVGSNGAVKLADFGVSACMFDAGGRQRSRNTFVGTPCWMAPEVMQQLHGYDFKADIWSFGITALELAHGHAPFSKHPPMKVLLMTLQNAPPGLDYERDKRFSKSFKDLVAACLVKDPKKRPTSEKLLRHHFFKHAHSVDYLSRTILHGLCPLGDRFRTLKEKEADFLLQNKALYGDKDQLSQQEYIRGISAWNFNLEDLKSQAALIHDDAILNIEDSIVSGIQRNGNNDVNFLAEDQPKEMDSYSDASPHYQDEPVDINDLENTLDASSIKPLQALNEEVAVGSTSPKDSVTSYSEQQSEMQLSLKADCQEVGRGDVGSGGESSSLPQSVNPQQNFLWNSSLLQDNVPSPKKFIVDVDRDHLKPRHLPERSFSGPLLSHSKKDLFNPISAEDAPEKAVIQQKGRFKVTSAELSPKAPTNGLCNSVFGDSASPITPILAATSVLPSLQCILQQNTMQREEIVKLIKYVEQTSVNSMEGSGRGTNVLSPISSASSKERELQSQLIQLQQSVGNLVEELQRQKVKNALLEKKLNFFSRERGESTRMKVMSDEIKR